MNFNEVRVYTQDQTTAILAARVSKSWQVRAANGLGYVTAAGGAGLAIDNTLRKSPSQSGTILSLSGLSIPLLTSWLAKDTPKYSINNPPPAVISLASNACADYSVLAGYGKAPVTIGPRRVDPLVVK